MEIKKRVQDVETVFNKRWEANHNYQEVKKFHDDRKDHFKKVNNIPDVDARKEELKKVNSIEGKLNRLDEKMKVADFNERFSRMNDIKRNFR